MSENEQLSHTHGNAVTREAVATPMAMRPARFTSAEYLRPPARPRRLQTRTRQAWARVILATVTLSSAMCGAGGDGAAPCRGRLLTRAHTLGLRVGDGGGKRGALPRGARVHNGEASKIERFPARALICVLPQGTQLANGAYADASMHGARARASALSLAPPLTRRRTQTQDSGTFAHASCSHGTRIANCTWMRAFRCAQASSSTF